MAKGSLVFGLPLIGINYISLLFLILDAHDAADVDGDYDVSKTKFGTRP